MTSNTVPFQNKSPFSVFRWITPFICQRNGFILKYFRFDLGLFTKKLNVQTFLWHLYLNETLWKRDSSSAVTYIYTYVYIYIYTYTYIYIYMKFIIITSIDSGGNKYLISKFSYWQRNERLNHYNFRFIWTEYLFLEKKKRLNMHLYWIWLNKYLSGYKLSPKTGSISPLALRKYSESQLWRHLSTGSIDQVPPAPPWPRPESEPRTPGTRCPPAVGCSNKEETTVGEIIRQEKKPWPSVWGSMQDLTSWGINGHENF